MIEPKRMRLIAPDGGWGWVVLIAAMVVNVLIPGTIKSFGVLFVEFMKVFNATPTEASWMPALCYFLYASLGPLSSILSAKYSYRTVTLIGGAFAAGGMMLSYLANSVTYLYFSYGVMVGVGAGLSFPVTIYIVSEYFDKYRGLASGLCISGSCIGTIVIPPFMQYLLDTVGYRMACLIIGAILIITIFCAFFFQPVERHMKLIEVQDDEDPSQKQQQQLGSISEKVQSKDFPTTPQPQPRHLSSHRSSIVSTVGPVTLDPHHEMRVSISRNLHNKRMSEQYGKQHKELSSEDSKPYDNGYQEELNEYEERSSKSFGLAILKDPLYLVILISNASSAIGNTNFMILLPLYASSEGHDKDLAAYLLSIVSLLDLIGRIGGAALSDTHLMPKHYYFVFGLGTSGIALALMPIYNNYVYLASFCALFGLSSGLYIGTTAVVLADMLGPEKLASSYGISLFVNGVLQLVGPPVCNVAFERIGSFKPIFMALGMILVCGTALWGFLPFIKRQNQSEKSGEKVAA